MTLEILASKAAWLLAESWLVNSEYVMTSQYQMLDAKVKKLSFKYEK